MDRGLENRGKLQDLVRAHGILLRYIGVESAHQLGRGERQGGILKDIMKTTILSRQLRGRQNMGFVVTESVCVKNHRINHNGFSPAQWVLGRNPPEIDALTTLDSAAKCRQTWSASGDPRRRDVLRPTDGHSWSCPGILCPGRLFTSNQSRLTTPSRGPFLMGDLVCYHKKQGANRHWKWYGRQLREGQRAFTAKETFRGVKSHVHTRAEHVCASFLHVTGMKALAAWP